MKSLTTKKLPYKITSDNIIRAKEYLDKIWASKTTIQLLLNYLNRREDLENLSTTEVYYILRRILKYSYKRRTDYQNKMMTRDQKWYFIGASHLQLVLK